MKKNYLKNFNLIKIAEKDLKIILALRNQKKIRSMMINKNIIKFREHFNWFNNLKKSNFFHFYCFIKNKKILGAGYASDFDKKKKFCYWGLYRDLRLKNKIKYGSVLKYLLMEKLFSLDNISYLKCKVVKSNKWVRQWYESWGHRYVYFNRHDQTHNLILTKSKWLEIRKYILINKL
jgi:UDP-4-amino-4,6-dideoxy-N-acetyl-beta-L-altrosamine N-acetyltransferase